MALLLVCSFAAVAATVHVDNAPNGCSPKDGSEACPYQTIQDGIDNASAGDEVLVLPGTYCEWIFMANGVDVVSRDGAAVTTIDAGGGGGICPDQDFAAVRFTTSSQVTRLAGFTISGGKGRPRTAAQRGQAGGARAGGGIFIFQNDNSIVTPIIENNVITGNTLVTTDSYNFPLLIGAGIYIAVGRPLITSNVITGNSASDPSGLYGYGGGIYAANYSRPEVSSNTITGNSAMHEGGALYLKTLPFSPTARIDANLIEGNTSGRIAGGILIGANADVTVTNNVIRQNHADTRAGGIHTYYASADIRNNTIVGNTAGRTGGIFLGDSDDQRSVSLHNNVISGNTATYAEFAAGIHMLPANPMTLSFTHNDLVDNVPADFGGGFPDPSTLPGNISVTPVFLNPGAGDLRLAPGSAGVDDGDDGVAPAADVFGVARPQDGDADTIAVVDMGAHELVLTSGDDDGDGVFNDGDLSGVQGDNPCTGGAVTVCDDNCPALSNALQENLDGDAFGDVCDPDDDADGYLDEDETTNCSPPSDPLNILSTPADNDGDLLCDTIDADDDNDGYLDVAELNDCGQGVPLSDPFDALSTPPDNDGDFNCDFLDPDDDNDGFRDDEETMKCQPNSDPLDAGSTPPDNDGDLYCDTLDPDDDNDTVMDLLDSHPFDPLRCLDVEPDTCDDCSAGAGPDAANDGLDTDADGLCDAGDPDRDNDGVENASDCEPLINSVDSIPSEVPLFVTFTGAHALSWPLERQSNVFNVYRMSVAPGAPFTYSFGCAAAEVPASQWTDPLSPALGELLAYLVTGANTCGEGPAHFDSAGAPIPAPAPLCIMQGADTDSDSILDVNDNCPQVGNPAQEDQDLDGLGDACDACPTQPPPPGIGSSLTLAADAQTLSWDPDPAADSYEVHRGAVAGGSFTYGYECIDSVLGGTSSVDPTVPAPGAFLYYIVRSANACDASGPGLRGNGRPRPYPPACTAP